MPAQALTYALLANPKLVETGYNVAKGTAITVGKILLYGAVGYGTYKALSTFIDRAQAKALTKQAISNINNTAYKAALYFTNYFQNSSINKQAIKELIKQVYIHNDFAETARYYFQINFGKSWKSDCSMGIFFCKEFDKSGDLVQHLKTALGDEFKEIINYLGTYNGR